MIGIAVVAMSLFVALAMTVAMVIIVVAILIVVAMAVALSHRWGRRQCERNDCARSDDEPSPV